MPKRPEPGRFENFFFTFYEITQKIPNQIAPKFNGPVSGHTSHTS
jgi:hypothetical protein